MMIKKVDTCNGGGAKGAKTTDFGGIPRFKVLFCQSVCTKPPNLLKKCISVFYTIPPNLMPKFWQENFIWAKKQDLH